MPRDQRLYMTFPIDFWMHPKIAPLSDGAFRAFVELNGYSRMQDLDGRVPVAIARKQWKPRALGELLANHPERPSLSVDGDDYVIWNYEEHQMTKADRDALVAKNTANGKKGGRPRKNPVETQSVSSKNPTETQPKAESELRVKDRQTDITDPHSHVTLVDARDVDQDEMKFVVEAAAEFGVKNIQRAQRAFEAALDQPITPAEAVDLARAVLDLSNDHVRYTEAYIERTCEKSPHEVLDAWNRLPHPGKAAAA